MVKKLLKLDVSYSDSENRFKNKINRAPTLRTILETIKKVAKLIESRYLRVRIHSNLSSRHLYHLSRQL